MPLKGPVCNIYIFCEKWNITFTLSSLCLCLLWISHLYGLDIGSPFMGGGGSHVSTEAQNRTNSRIKCKSSQAQRQVTTSKLKISLFCGLIPPTQQLVPKLEILQTRLQSKKHDGRPAEKEAMQHHRHCVSCLLCFRLQSACFLIGYRSVPRDGSPHTTGCLNKIRATPIIFRARERLKLLRHLTLQENQVR